MSFKDIQGQDNAITVLKANIEEDRVFSSYLFVGPEGIGKAKTAVNFAKALNCLGKNELPCGECISCKKIDSGTHPDIFFIEPEGASSSIGIEKIRTVIGRANLKPYEAKRKVFVVNDAHSMSQEASNAFLKTLEESPKNSVFVLVSTSREAMLPTIVSRCHVINFFPVSREEVQKILVEKNNVKENEAKVLSSFSGGRIGKALKMLEEDVISRKNDIIDSFLSQDADSPKIINTYSSRKDLTEDIDFIVSYLRDVLLYKSIKDKNIIFNQDRISDIERMSGKFSEEDIENTIKEIIKLRSYVGYNVNPKIVIDVLTSELRRYNERSSTSKAA